MEYIKPSQTETHLKQKKLNDIEFPVVFKFCFKNSFDLSKLKESGYSSVWDYFEGKSRYNDSIYGWAGHSADGSVGAGIEGNH